MTSLEIIVKLVERCNLNCSYCYFFNRGDESYRDNPALIGLPRAQEIGRFVNRAVDDLGFDIVHIYLHGGEPLLYPKGRFDTFCNALLDEISSGIRTTLALQTNGLLVDDEWISLFARHSISVSVSIDGPPDVNDRLRLDHGGRPSYTAAAAGFRRLRDAHRAGRLVAEPGLLSVIDAGASGARVYEHFRQSLDARVMDFLVPDFTHDDCPDHVRVGVGEFLDSVFQAWLVEDDPRVDIRILRSAIQLVMGRNSGLMGLGPPESQSVAVSISSAGEIQPDDVLRPLRGHLGVPRRYVGLTSLKDFLDLPEVGRIDALRSTIPEECATCKFRSQCRGGPLVNRFSTAQAFTRKTVLCESNYRLFESASRFVDAHHRAGSQT